MKGNPLIWKKIQGGEILLFGLDTIFVGDPRKLKPSPATVWLGCGSIRSYIPIIRNPRFFLVDCQPFFRHDTFTLRVTCHQLTFHSHYFIYMPFQVCPRVKKIELVPTGGLFKRIIFPKSPACAWISTVCVHVLGVSCTHKRSNDKFFICEKGRTRPI